MVLSVSNAGYPLFDSAFVGLFVRLPLFPSFFLLIDRLNSEDALIASLKKQTTIARMSMVMSQTASQRNAQEASSERFQTGTAQHIHATNMEVRGSGTHSSQVAKTQHRRRHTISHYHTLAHTTQCQREVLLSHQHIHCTTYILPSVIEKCA